MKKRILAAALALTLCGSMLPVSALAAASMENFQMTQTYRIGQFTDVNAASWYAESVETAYELGLVLGTSDTTFEPNGNITINSALALACRLHSIYNTGKADFQQGTPWYQVYVDYALENGLITQGQFSNYNANATRRQFAAILAKALPAAALSAINTVEDGAIPDVSMSSAYADSIYLLYRAGVLTGTNEGKFAPEDNITRSGVAAIVARMAVPDLRQTLDTDQVAVTGLTLNRTSLSLNEGESYTLTATVQPSNATDKTVTWSSSNSRIATVSSSGVVTARAEGTATITATAKGGAVSRTCTVTVEEVNVTGVTVSPSSLTLEEGESRTLIATVRPSDASDQSVTWSTSDSSVATVSSNGTVTAVGAGSATITASTINGRTDTCRVTVEASQNVSLAVPLLNHEYGPMTVTSYYSSGEVMHYNNISSLVFTGAELNRRGDRYDLTLSIQGYTDYDSCWFDIRFYDASGRMITEETVIEGVAPNQNYNILFTVHVDADLLDQAVRMEFYSYDGYPATPGNTGGTGNTGNTGNTGGTENEGGTTTPEPDYGYEMYSGFSGIPTFDQFTSSDRTSLSSSSSNTAGYLYPSATQEELNAYMAALEACGFTSHGSIGTMTMYDKGTSGQDGYWEVRITTSSSPSSTGMAVTIGLSKVKPANEW